MEKDNCAEIAKILSSARPPVQNVEWKVSSVDEFAAEYVRQTIDKSNLEHQGEPFNGLRIEYQEGIYHVEVYPIELMDGNNNRARQTVIKQAKRNGLPGTIFFYPQQTVRDYDLRKIQQQVKSGFVPMAYNPKRLEDKLRARTWTSTSGA